MNRLKTVVLQHWKRFHEHWKGIETVNVYRCENVCNVRKSTFFPKEFELKTVYKKRPKVYNMVSTFPDYISGNGTTEKSPNSGFRGRSPLNKKQKEDPNMKKLVALVAALVLALTCTAVFADEAKKEFNVTVLVWKFDDTYGSSVRQGMLKWAEAVGEELGVKINLDMQDAGDDMAKQVEQCDQAIGKKPDFVIINLAEPAGGQTLVDKLTEAKIPFLFYNIPPSEETYESVVKNSGAFFIGTLPREAGDMQGEILADIWNADKSIDKNGDGTIQFVEFKGVANNPEAIARTQYSEETAKELGVPLEMVTDIIVADWDTTKANDAMKATWASHPEIELVFANNDDMAIGVIAALSETGYNTGNEGDPSIAVIGVDATDAAFEAIKAGKMTATVKQDGDAMGEANIRIMMNYLLNGEWGAEALGYKVNDDGCSTYIPYAKITAESVK